MIFVCLFLREISDLGSGGGVGGGGGDYGDLRLLGCNTDQRNVTPLSSG